MMQKSKKSNFHIKYKADYVNLFVSLLFFLLSIYTVLFFSAKISEDVRRGLSFCYTVIIPSVFPFMIVSDFIENFVHFERIGFLRRVFSKLFKVNGYAISALVCGILCGFPMGVKISKELYVSGKISKKECERLIGFSNNASPAFVISGIGVGLFSSFKLGVFLYLISIFSSMATGIFFSLSSKSEKESEIKKAASFSFTKSIKNASLSTLNICGFICFFSVLIGFLERLIKETWLIATLSSFLEIGNAGKIIAESQELPIEFRIALLAFSISFSGLSVHMQSKSFLLDTDISMSKYYIMKLFSGAISFIITSIFLFFI